MPRFCASCGAPRDNGIEGCSDCGDTGYSLIKTLTHLNWLRKHKKVRTTRCIIAGPDNYPKYKGEEIAIRKKLDSLTRKLKDMFILSGGVKGVNRVATDWALAKGYSTELYHAPEGRDRRKAGLERNRELIEHARRAKFAILWWNGEDSVIQNLIVLCKQRGIHTVVIDHE